MKNAMLILATGLLLIVSSAFANDVIIDPDGNITTGSSSTNANLEVIGASDEDGIVGSASGTGAAGVYGENRTGNNTNYGILGYDTYGVYGYSLNGYAGYFYGNTRITGDLRLDGSLLGFSETDPVFSGSPSFGITSGQISNWNTVYSWGDHSLEGYDTSDDAWTGTGDVYMTSGNVGIGTSSPGYKLTVEGDTSITGDVNIGGAPPGAARLAVRGNNSGTAGYFTSDSGYGLIVENGNVGIGTTAPESKLDVTESSGRSKLIIKGSGDTYNYSELSFGNTNNTKEWNLINRKFSDYLNGFTLEEYDGSAYKTRIAVNANNVNNGRIYLNPHASGGVSIGSDFTGPAEGYGWNKLGDLHVFSNDLSLIEFVGRGDDWNYNILTLEAFEPEQGYPHWSFIHRKNEDIGGASHGLGFEYWDGATYDIKMAIAANGNVGIGSNNPSQKLTVAGIIESTIGGIMFPDGSSLASAETINADKVDGHHASAFALSDHSHVGTDTASSTVDEAQIDALIARDSEVETALDAHADNTDNPHSMTAGQIGAAALSHDHDASYVNLTGDTITGDLLVTGIVDVNSDLYVVGNLYLESDAESKKDIIPIDSSLDKIKNIRGISFTWKDERSHGAIPSNVKHYGVIAQEVENVLPDIVKTGKNGRKKVAYMELIPVLIEAVKEQQKVVEKQQNTIAVLLDKVTELEEKVKQKGTIAIVNTNTY